MQTSEKAINFLQRNMDVGRAIPGQSLTADPDNPYPWESPPEFSIPQDAMVSIFETLTEKETLGNILVSLIKGVSVIDIASITLYSGFLEGKWNPDLMLLLMEPTMYMIMYLGDSAKIDYLMDSKQESNIDEIPGSKQLDKITNSLDDLKRVAADRVSPMSVTPEIQEKLENIEVPESLLSRAPTPVKTESLLNREN